MNFVCHCKWLVVLACASLTVLLSGCGGVNAGGGASPASFLIPGVVGHEGSSEHPSYDHLSDVPENEAVDTIGSTVFYRDTIHFCTDTDPS